jgi:hypothetical protein
LFPPNFQTAWTLPSLQRLWSPLCRGYPAEVTSLQRLLLCRGYLFAEVTSLQRLPPCRGYGPLFAEVTFADVSVPPKLENAPLFAEVTSSLAGQNSLFLPNFQTAWTLPSLQRLRSPLCRGYLFAEVTSLQRLLLCRGYLFAEVTSLQRLPLFAEVTLPSLQRLPLCRRFRPTQT